MRMGRLYEQLSIGMAVSILAATILVSCTSQSSPCASSSVLESVKRLIVGTKSSQVDGYLEISDPHLIGSSGSISRCEARFDVSRASRASLTKQTGNFAKELRNSAVQAGMSKDDIDLGTLSGIAEYTVETAAGNDGSQIADVTLSNFNLARSKVLSEYLRLTSLYARITDFRSPVVLTWSSKNNGDPKLYRSRDIEITLSSRSDSNSDIPDPVIRVEGYGSFLEHTGQGGFQDATANMLVGRLDPTVSTDQVVFMTYSGGAHCCTSIDILEFIDGKWTVLDMGSWDGEPLANFPKDIDGDHIPDLVVSDDSFDYQFASYADSYAPPVIFNVVNGDLANVSSNPRYTAFYRDRMTEYQSVCLLHNNGACAAFLAVASRIGYFSYAWQFLLENYDQSSNWSLPKLCRVALEKGQCPTGQDYDAPNYPSAVAGFLTVHGYPVPSELMPQSTFSPSFNCSKVTSHVLALVCGTPQLSMLDQDLAAAYLAAKSASKTPDMIKASEIGWIKMRNNSQADVDTLTEFYKARISALEESARTDASSGQQQ
jgi:hypothetical protein